jgi:hypothetical protein
VLEPGVCGSAVPVLYFCGNGDYGSRGHRHCFLAPFLQEMCQKKSHHRHFCPIYAGGVPKIVTSPALLPHLCGWCARKSHITSTFAPFLRVVCQKKSHHQHFCPISAGGVPEKVTSPALLAHFCGRCARISHITSTYRTKREEPQSLTMGILPYSFIC